MYLIVTCSRPHSEAITIKYHNHLVAVYSAFSAFNVKTLILTFNPLVDSSNVLYIKLDYNPPYVFGTIILPQHPLTANTKKLCLIIIVY